MNSTSRSSFWEAPLRRAYESRKVYERLEKAYEVHDMNVERLMNVWHTSLNRVSTESHQSLNRVCWTGRPRKCLEYAIRLLEHIAKVSRSYRSETKTVHHPLHHSLHRSLFASSSASSTGDTQRWLAYGFPKVRNPSCQHHNFVSSSDIEDFYQKFKPFKGIQILLNAFLFWGDLGK